MFLMHHVEALIKGFGSHPDTFFHMDEMVFLADSEAEVEAYVSSRDKYRALVEESQAGGETADVWWFPEELAVIQNMLSRQQDRKNLLYGGPGDDRRLWYQLVFDEVGMDAAEYVVWITGSDLSKEDEDSYAVSLFNMLFDEECRLINEEYGLFQDKE